MTLVLAWECFIFYFSFYHGEMYISLHVSGINVAFHLKKSKLHQDGQDEANVSLTLPDIADILIKCLSWETMQNS